MKILIAYHRFPPIAKCLKDAFIHQGVECEIFYTTDYEHWFYRYVIRYLNKHAQNLRLIPRGYDLFKNHRLNFKNHLCSSFQEKIKNYQPDALLVIHGQPFGNELLESTTLPKIGWWLEPSEELPNIIENATPFDIYNSFSQKAIDLLLSAGYSARYLNHAVDPQDFHSLDTTKKSYDVVFVGNWSPWRDEVLKSTLKITSRVALYGPYWKKKSSISKRQFNAIYKGKEIVGPELNKLFNSTKIVLNASRDKGSAGLNMRFFEVPASGALFLTDDVLELERHFSPDQHIVVYSTTQELENKLSELLQNEKLAISIAKSGQDLVLNNYTYDHMARHFLNQFEEIKNILQKPQN